MSSISVNYFPDNVPIVLIIDDERIMRLQLKQAMEQKGYRVLETSDGAEALELYDRYKPEVVLLDAVMPKMDGFTCCTMLQSSTQHHAPVLMITGLDDEESVDRAFAVGAVDYVTKPIHWAVLQQRVRRLIDQTRLQQQQAVLYQQLEAANQALQKLASTDNLTGIANRRRFEECLHQEWYRAVREQLPLSLILCDVDYFKRYNDTYGHPAGDNCLQQVAKAITCAARRSFDLVARYGGEEFAVILPNTELVGAKRIAESIQAQVHALSLVHVTSSASKVVTMSCGITSAVPNQALAPEMLVQTADQALYQAKQEGRDRAVYKPFA